MADTDLLVVSRGGVEYKITRGELDAYLNDGYTVVDSMLFNGTDAYLNRLPTVEGNRMTWTWSGWVKRGKLGVVQGIMGSAQGTSTSYFDTVFFDADDKLYCRFRIAGAGDKMYRVTTQTFRDPSAWYHFVFQYDTDGKTASPDNFKMYVNNELITDYVTSAGTLTTDWESSWNGLYTQVMGRRSYTPAGTYLDGYISEVNSVDGQALEPSAFGKTGAFGEWLPKKYSGTYGTNGFYLEALDSADLGKDTSGNGNDFTNDNAVQVTDTPTDNYVVMNPLAYSPSMTYSNGNLKLNGTLESWYSSPATIYVDSGKWYWETTITSRGTYSQVGIAEEDWLPNSSPGLEANAYGYYSFNGNALRDGTSTAYGATYTTGDVIGITLDYDNGEITYYKNGVSQGVAFTGVTERLTPASALYGSATHNYNFGQTPFTYAVPTGFKAISTKNLPDATVVPSDSFGVGLWTGNGSASGPSVTNLNFKPELLWSKSRSTVANNYLYDIVRSPGDSPNKFLGSNTTDAEQTFNAFTLTDTGFNLATDNVYFNQADQSYVAWNWKAGGTAVTNNEGTIESQVSANPEAGFSVVSYDGNSTAGATVGHGLSQAPEMMIVKSKNYPGSSYQWFVYHKDILNSTVLILNANNAVISAGNAWNSTDPDNSVFTLGTNGAVNVNTGEYINYCFNSVEGYSQFGSYIGNGNANGPFVFTGFKPAYVMIKKATGTGSWLIYDDARAPTNSVGNLLYADTSATENPVTNRMDFVSNGIKLRTDDASHNTVNSTYIYMAFAEQPFKNANAR